MTPAGARRSLELGDFIGRHPLRPRILDRVAELDLETGGEGASPVELARRLDASLGVVAYHVRALRRRGALELVGEARVRGSVEHFYRVTAAGDEARARDPLELAVRALERIAADDQGATVATRHAEEALEALGRWARSSVYA